LGFDFVSEARTSFPATPFAFKPPWGEPTGADAAVDPEAPPATA
jgi:hypothetical protein